MSCPSATRVSKDTNVPVYSSSGSTTFCKCEPCSLLVSLLRMVDVLPVGLHELMSTVYVALLLKTNTPNLKHSNIHAPVTIIQNLTFNVAAKCTKRPHWIVVPRQWSQSRDVCILYCTLYVEKCFATQGWLCAWHVVHHDWTIHKTLKQVPVTSSGNPVSLHVASIIE